VYENVKRATISLFTDESDDATTAYLMVSFEKDVKHEEIITAKILPFLRRVGRWM
jgi:hypothetical protein